MVKESRACIGEIGGDPNKAAAKVLYELMVDEDAHSVDVNEDASNSDPSNYFETFLFQMGTFLVWIRLNIQQTLLTETTRFRKTKIFRKRAEKANSVEFR